MWRLTEKYGERAAALLMRPRRSVVGELRGIFAVGKGSGSKTQQHLRDEVDINTIMRRFAVTGQMPFMDPGGVYGDFSEIHDYASAAAVVQRADERFMQLPAEIRERFANSPAEFIEFARSSSREAFDEALRVAVAAPVPAAPVPAEAPSE